MSKESYFSQYVSPNIVIVPTVSVCDPNTGNKPDTVNSNRILNVEQNIEKNINVLCASNCNKCKEGVVNETLSTIRSTDTSDYSKKIPQVIVSTKDSANNMSLSVKEMSSSKYKSRNNLVDLTGFNILKRDCINTSTKYQDSKKPTKTKIDYDLIKNIDNTKENLKREGSATCQKENKSNKESSKRCSEKPSDRRSDDNTKDGGPKEKTIDMEEKMKKYFKHLWKRNLEKLKDKSTKVKRERDIKSITTDRRRKDSKLESCKTKAKLQKITKNTNTKSSKNKLKDLVSAKETHDCDRKSKAEYSSTKVQRERNSKSESCRTSVTKTCTKDQKQFLSPVSMKRYKDFQRFIHNNDEIIKHNTEKQIKMKKSHSKEPLLKSSNLAINSESNKRILERKQSVNVKNNNNHSEVNTTSLVKKEKVPFIKSVVKVNRNLNDDSSRSKYNKNKREDLRAKISRKRTRSECFTRSQQILDHKLDQENFAVTVKQDVKTDTKILAKLAPNANKPKTKKCKKIKLVINIECPNSDSDSDQNGNEFSASPQDLSFLDDFNIDEIVDSLRTSHSPTENNQINTTETSPHLINKINDDEIINKPNESRPKERLIDNLNMKAIKIKNEETEQSSARVIVINSDTEYEELEIGSVDNAKKNKDDVKLKPNSKPDKNIKQEASNVKELTKKPVRNVQEILKDICDESDDSEGEIKHFLPKNNQIKTSLKSQKTSQVSKSSTKFDRPNAKDKKESLKTANQRSHKIGSKDSTQKVNKLQNKKITALTKTNTNKKTRLLLQNPDSRINSLEAVKKAFKNDITKNFESLNTRHEINNIKGVLNTKISADPIEISLEALFKNTEQKISTNKSDIEISGSDKRIKERMKKDGKLFLQNSGCSVEASLETMFNDINHECNMNLGIGLTHTSDQHIQKGLELLRNTKDAITVSQETTNNIEQTSTINKIQINLPNKPDKHIKIQPDLSQKTEANVQVMQNSIENNIQLRANIKINEGSSETSKNIKQKSEQINIKSCSGPSQGKSKKGQFQIENEAISSLEIINNIKETKSECQIEKISRKTSDRNIQEKAENLQLPRRLSATPENNIDKQAKMAIKLSHTSDVAMRNQPDNILVKPEKIMEKSLEAVKNIEEQNDNQNNTRSVTRPDDIIKEVEYLQNSKPTESLEATLNNIENNRAIKIHMKPFNMSDKSLKEKAENLREIAQQVSNESRGATTNINQKNSHTNTQIATVSSNKKCKEIAENAQKSTKTVTPFLEAPYHSSKDKTIIIENSNIPDKNVNEKIEVHLHKSENTTKGISDDTINNFEKKTIIKMDINSSNISEKHIEDKTGKNLVEETLVTPAKQLNKSNGNTNVEPSSNTNKNEEAYSSLKECARPEKSLPTKAKSNAEEKQVESLKTDTNNIQKSGTTVDEVSKIKDLNKNSANKDSKTNKLEETKIETSTKLKEKQNDSKSIQNDETKSKQLETTLPPKLKPFAEKLEARMLEYLEKKYTVTSLIHNGNFSMIYKIKCRDVKGENYAVKAYKAEWKGVFVDRMLSKLQENRIKGNSSLLYLINGFRVQGYWCLLTEYYPHNLEEALQAKKKSFHIDLVQVLSRQLVEAVNMVTNNNIIHSDIKPSHILLNSELNRLKLSGFDRANHSDRIKIIPSTGTPSYRAPEVILGFLEDHKIDVWSTALVMFEMATNTKLFPGLFNNDILYKQLCTLGSLDWEMVENSRYNHLYFVGTSFMRQVGRYGEETLQVHVLHRNKKLRNTIFMSYKRQWARYRTRWQSTKDLDKLERLHTLLEQMLATDPRNRLPIQFVSASEFIHDVSI